MMRLSAIIFIFSITFLSADWVFGPEGFEDRVTIINGSYGNPLYWFAPDYSSPLFVYSSGFESDSAIGSGTMSWPSWWGNFIRTPLINCSSADSVVLSFRMWNTADPGNNDYARFYIWVEPIGYRGTTTLSMGTGHSRDWELVNIDFTEYAAGESQVYFYLEPNFGTGSFTRECKFDDIGVSSNTVLSIGERVGKPIEYSIFAHPNPFNSAVSISVGEGLNPARIEIYDIAGRTIDIISESDWESSNSPEIQNSHFHGNDKVVIWTPATSVGSGVYFLRVVSEDVSISKRIVYLK